MKEEQEIREEADRLFNVFMDPAKKKPLRDESFIKFHALMWVLEDREDIIQKRLREMNAGRSKASEAE